MPRSPCSLNSTLILRTRQCNAHSASGTKDTHEATHMHTDMPHHTHQIHPLRTHHIQPIPAPTHTHVPHRKPHVRYNHQPPIRTHPQHPYPHPTRSTTPYPTSTHAHRYHTAHRPSPAHRNGTPEPKPHPQNRTTAQNSSPTKKPKPNAEPNPLDMFLAKYSTPYQFHFVPSTSTDLDPSRRPCV